MFTKKKDSLFKAKRQSVTRGNRFIEKAQKESSKTSSENGALKYSSTGDAFVDQFGKLGSYTQPRSFRKISSDMAALFAINPRLSVMFIIYMRIVTRVTTLFNGVRTKSPQRGAGLKHESIMRMMWLSIFHPDVFWKNIELFIAVGSWKDIFKMLSFDLQYNGWEGRQLDWEKFKGLIIVGLDNPNTVNLVKKYLPQIRAKSRCTTVESQAGTIIGKWITSFMFKEESSRAYRKYREMKTSGTAHQWQKLISQRRFELIDFNTVHGKALAKMVSGKFLVNNKLEKAYEAWISKKPVAKFTGYPHELFEKIQSFKRKYQIDTLNKQFMGLVETARAKAISSTGMIVVRDTSGSMQAPARGTNMSSYNIAKAMALFMSYMLPKGAFANAWIEFNRQALLHTWKGSTPYEKWMGDHTSAIGNTSFMSVIDLFCKMKLQGITEEEFPTGIICISDGEFDPTELSQTNVNAARRALKINGFSEEYVQNFKIVLWNIPNDYYRSKQTVKFEGDAEQKNTFYFSGYDPSVLAFLTGLESTKGEESPKNAKELFDAAMNQEILQLVEI
jgi:hypothetical protein